MSTLPEDASTHNDTPARSVLITGCDTGLGVEFARQYAAEGYRVFATCLDPDAADAARAIEGRRARAQARRFRSARRSTRWPDELRSEPIDILVSNAGLGKHHPPFGQTDYAQWQRILDVNLIGPMKLAEAFVEHVAASRMKVMAFVSSRMGSIAPQPDRRLVCLSIQQGGTECRREVSRDRSPAATHPRARAASGVGQDRTGRARRCRPQRVRHARRHRASRLVSLAGRAASISQ